MQQACALPYRRQSGTIEFCLITTRRNVRWSFPKGSVDQGESPIDAAVREVGEETSITDLEFEWGERFMDTGPYNRGKIARYYLARTNQESVEMGIAPELGRPEHHKYRWISFDEAFDLSAPRVRLVVQWARQFIGT